MTTVTRQPDIERSGHPFALLALRRSASVIHQRVVDRGPASNDLPLMTTSQALPFWVADHRQRAPAQHRLTAFNFLDQFQAWKAVSYGDAALLPTGWADEEPHR